MSVLILLLFVSAFRTDADISKGKVMRERELQAWQPADSTTSAGPPTVHHEGAGDEITFGTAAANNSSWDQFAVNEHMFGVTTSYDEEVYTTKLDRNAADFKERERKAQRIASEIMGVCSRAREHFGGLFNDVLTCLADYHQQSACSRGEKSEPR